MLFTAIILGFAGSLHCLGMCSPLALAVTAGRKPFMINRIIYNGGRILTYGLLGATAAAFGSLFRIPDSQNILSIVLGVMLILLGITGVSTLRIPFLTTVLVRLNGQIKNLFTLILQRKSTISFVIMGMMNGLLPCGLTYLALTYCLTINDSLYGFLFMLIFGVGTLPAMLGATSIIQLMINRFKINFKKTTTALMILMGILLISRTLLNHQHHNHPVEKEIVICKKGNK